MKLNYKKKTDEIKCNVLFNLMDPKYFFFFILEGRTPPAPYYAACGILVPWPGIEPTHRAVEAGSPNH